MSFQFTSLNHGQDRISSNESILSVGFLANSAYNS